MHLYTYLARLTDRRSHKSLNCMLRDQIGSETRHWATTPCPGCLSAAGPSVSGLKISLMAGKAQNDWDCKASNENQISRISIGKKIQVILCPIFSFNILIQSAEFKEKRRILSVSFIVLSYCILFRLLSQHCIWEATNQAHIVQDCMVNASLFWNYLANLDWYKYSRNILSHLPFCITVCTSFFTCVKFIKRSSGKRISLKKKESLPLLERLIKFLPFDNAEHKAHFGPPLYILFICCCTLTCQTDNGHLLNQWRDKALLKLSLVEGKAIHFKFFQPRQKITSSVEQASLIFQNVSNRFLQMLVKALFLVFFCVWGNPEHDRMASVQQNLLLPVQSYATHCWLENSLQLSPPYWNIFIPDAPKEACFFQMVSKWPASCVVNK